MYMQWTTSNQIIMQNLFALSLKSYKNIEIDYSEWIIKFYQIWTLISICNIIDSNTENSFDKIHFQLLMFPSHSLVKIKFNLTSEEKWKYV